MWQVSISKRSDDVKSVRQEADLLELQSSLVD
jgi:hypothetical protein